MSKTPTRTARPRTLQDNSATAPPSVSNPFPLEKAGRLHKPSRAARKPLAHDPGALERKRHASKQRVARTRFEFEDRTVSIVTEIIGPRQSEAEDDRQSACMSVSARGREALTQPHPSLLGSRRGPWSIPERLQPTLDGRNRLPTRFGHVLFAAQQRQRGLERTPERSARSRAEDQDFEHGVAQKSRQRVAFRAREQQLGQCVARHVPLGTEVNQR